MFGFNFDRRTLYMIIGILVVMSLMSYGTEGIFSLILSVPAVLLAITVHEFGHAFAAYKLGDETPRLSGRLTLNPLAHIDLMGALMIFLCGFGYAKPVSVNPRNFKDPKKGMAITAIAGPISNLIMGFFFTFLSIFVQTIFYKLDMMLLYPVVSFLYFAAAINVNLAVFNLLPIPPLDGSRILQLLIPAKYYYKFLQYERYVVIVVFILILTGVLSTPLAIISSLILNLFSIIAEIPFSIF
jgi:Zn-dependent protease